MENEGNKYLLTALDIRILSKLQDTKSKFNQNSLAREVISSSNDVGKHIERLRVYGLVKIEKKDNIKHISLNDTNIEDVETILRIFKRFI